MYDYLILSGCTRLTDGWTDGQTDVDSKVRSNEVRCAQKCVDGWDVGCGP